MNVMNILHVCAEFYPLVKTGGLADVTGALSKAQNQLGHHARVLIPGYPSVMSGVADNQIIASQETFAGKITLRFGYYQEIGIYIIDAPHLYERRGSPYHDSSCNDYSDNHLRFALLGWVATEIACGLDVFWQPNIVHSHDWHAGLTNAYLHDKAAYHQAKSVFTIHNLAYSGSFSTELFPQLQLPARFLQMEGIEFNGQISYLKAGLYYADHITTVSPTYAKEITTVDMGDGFAGLLQEKRATHKLTGILNGIDESVWDPRNDPLIHTPYSRRHLSKKQSNKFALQQELDLIVSSQPPVFAVISRLTHQKGLDFLLAALPTILQQGGQFILLGAGDGELENAFLQFLVRPEYLNQIAIYSGYNEGLAHRIIAGADVILVPSRFEPCGLTQLYGLKYGTLPLVRATGGLADTVIDGHAENIYNQSATGFSYQENSAHALIETIERALQLWQDPKLWQQLQIRAMSQCYSWQSPAQAYLSLYAEL